MDALVRAAVGLVAPDEHARAQRSATTTPSTASRDPEAPASSPRAEAQEDACPICLEAQTETGTMLTTSCGHKFCASCLRAATTRSAACPLCRRRAHACLEKNRATCALCRADIPSIKEFMTMDSVESMRANAYYTRCTGAWVALLTLLSVLLLVYLTCLEMCPADARAMDALYSVPFWAVAMIAIIISMLNVINGAVCAQHAYVRAEQPATVAYMAALSSPSQSARVAPVPPVAPQLPASPETHGRAIMTPAGPSLAHGRPQLPV